LVGGLSGGVEGEADGGPGVAVFACGGDGGAEFGFGVGEVFAGGDDPPEVVGVAGLGGGGVEVVEAGGVGVGSFDGLHVCHLRWW